MSKEYTYHYYAFVQRPSDKAIVHFDGIRTTEYKITSYGQYLKFKEEILKNTGYEDLSLTISTMTLL